MKRRTFLKNLSLCAALTQWNRIGLSADARLEPRTNQPNSLDPAVARDWLARWEKNIMGDSRNRYCDRETGEEIGWLISPFLNGFYYGHQATQDPKWAEMLVDWTDSWTKRAVKEPDGFLGWPKSGTGGMLEDRFLTDSLLGEAMALRPAVLMAKEILLKPSLKEKFGPQAEAYLKLSGQVFEKWVARGCWRETKEGGVWVVPSFGIDTKSGGWTEGYEKRNSTGFSNPDNKQNHIARWLLAMHEATGKDVYREHAKKWWGAMKSRMKTRDNGKYFLWNYWEPAGPWDYKDDGSTRHWVGVHPNGGYYEIDVEGIVGAYEHGLVFTPEDLQRLIVTNRDFMWNHQVAGARFQRIDGGEIDARWKETPGMLWTSLVPYDETLKEIFLANHNPGSWGGLITTPWFLSKCASKPL